ncbi:MAG: hypothetical protein IT378_27505 [Sandaracinaceae bacterium]|nr:hypothetical protein [Sandaracinaceae bacterium]
MHAMPLVHVFPSREPEHPVALMRALSRAVAEATGKDERWVMVRVAAAAPALFGGSDAPCCYVELKSIGTLGEEGAARLSAALCGIVAEHLHVSPDRTYVELTDAEPDMWGWNGGTFA